MSNEEKVKLLDELFGEGSLYKTDPKYADVLKKVITDPSYGTEPYYYIQFTQDVDALNEENRDKLLKVMKGEDL